MEKRRERARRASGQVGPTTSSLSLSAASPLPVALDVTAWSTKQWKAVSKLFVVDILSCSEVLQGSLLVDKSAAHGDDGTSPIMPLSATAEQQEAVVEFIVAFDAMPSTLKDTDGDDAHTAIRSCVCEGRLSRSVLAATFRVLTLTLVEKLSAVERKLLLMFIKDRRRSEERKVLLADAQFRLSSISALCNVAEGLLAEAPQAEATLRKVEAPSLMSLSKSTFVTRAERSDQRGSKEISNEMKPCECCGDIYGDLQECKQCSVWLHEACGGPHPDDPLVVCKECRRALGFRSDASEISSQSSTDEHVSENSSDADSSLSGFLVRTEDLSSSASSSSNDDDDDDDVLSSSLSVVNAPTSRKASQKEVKSSSGGSKETEPPSPKRKDNDASRKQRNNRVTPKAVKRKRDD